MICPKCLSKNIVIYATQDVKVNADGEVIEYLHKPKWHEDTNAKCADCGESAVVWFFKRRG